jgi:chemotaxis protein methyltransferase CheR
MFDSVVSWNTVRAFMRERCGVVFDDEQAYLLEARLGPVARNFCCGSIDEYVQRACAPSAPPEITGALIEAMTTHETYFFRDPNYWQTFTDAVLPRLLDRPQGRPLRIWSCACSTGQEPYTVAMLLDELVPELAARSTIFASDVSEATLAFAQQGSYSMHEVNRGVTPARLLRYFDQEGSRFRIKSTLRSRISWSQQNLVRDVYRYWDVDVLLCRNVLIYFEEETRGRVLGALERCMRPGGILGVGVTEQVRWSRLAPGWFQAPLAARGPSGGP